MKRFLTVFCAIAFSGAALSAQNNADTIRVNRNDSDTLVIIVKEKQSIDRQANKEQKLADKAQRPDSASVTDYMSAVVQDSEQN